MSKPKRITFTVLIFAVLASGMVYFTFDLEKILYYHAKRELQKDVTDNLQRDGIEILFAGTGAPRYSEKRGQACLGVITDGKFMLFDTGQGCLDRLNKMDAPVTKISHIFLTHLHSDHMSGLGEVINNTWVQGRISPLEIYGPPGTIEVLDGFSQVYKEDVADRIARRGSDDMNPDLAHGVSHIVTVEDNEAVIAFEDNGLVIKAFRVDHPEWKYSYGYRIEYAGRLIVISGDTRFSQQMIRHGKDADILIHEAFCKPMLDAFKKAMVDLEHDVDPAAIDYIMETHTSTLDAARVAREAGAEQLVLTHIIPPLENWIAEKIFLNGITKIYKGNVILAEDGMRLHL
jgi:ribonuclease Z